MRITIEPLPALLCTLVLALAPGFASSTGDGDGGGDGGGDERSLVWARNLADNVRDTELPEGSLCNICCINVTDDGDSDRKAPWEFYYTEHLGCRDEKVLIVSVEYDGTTRTIWNSYFNIPPEGLPDYDDAGP